MEVETVTPFVPILKEKPVIPLNQSEQLLALHDLGFTKSSQNLKLLLRTGGDFEVVKNFLTAKYKLHEVSKGIKPSKIEKKFSKIEKKGRKTKNLEARLSKEERKKLRELKKSEKKGLKKDKKKEDKEEKKKSRKNTETSADAISVPFPEDVAGTTVYLDGNNMLYVCSVLRSMVIKRRMHDAEKILAQFAKAFAAKLNLSNCILVFDDIRKEEISASFSVLTARPKFATSDDAMVAWASANREKNLPAGVFVTSDRELQQRLKDVEGIIAKPKQWFQYACKVICGQEVPDLDAFMQSWVDANEELPLDKLAIA